MDPEQSDVKVLSSSSATCTFDHMVATFSRSYSAVKSCTVKPALSMHSKRNPKFGFQYRLSLNAGQKFCSMLQGEHSTMLSTPIKLPFPIKTLVLSIFK